jgi:glycosyltransferase involved in cell wall biosynthesis
VTPLNSVSEALPLVSVIIPNYNHAQFLMQRIESVINQTYPNIEVIILDDASSDNSLSIIREFETHPAVKKIVVNERNSNSPFKQWQSGLMHATGTWIWIAESDDYADVSFLQTLIDALTGRSNIGLVYCDSKIVTHSTISEFSFATLKNQNQKTDRWNHDYFNIGIDEIQDYLLPFGTINNTSAVLFNKKIFEEANPFDIGFRYIGDKYAFIKVLSKADVLYVKESLNYCRNPLTRREVNYLNLYKEHFLIFDWVDKNLPISTKKFRAAFYKNTRHTFYRDWGMVKLSLYADLLKKNPLLFTQSVLHNVVAPFFD